MPCIATGKALRLPWRLPPAQALCHWPAERPLAMLDSGRGHPRWGRYTILAEPIGAYRFDIIDDERGQSTWVGPAARTPLWTHDPFLDLQQIIADREAMWIGHIGYDIARFIERLPTYAAVDRHWPLIQMQRCPGWLIHDAVDDAWYAGGTYIDANHRPELPDLPALKPSFDAGEPTSVLSAEQYRAMVARAREYIAAGDIFQVNLSQRMTAPFTGHPRALYHQLATGSPAWYGAYIELLADAFDEPRRAIACTSPELFLELRPGGIVTTRPIKGTRPASADPDELLHSEKDAAELNMIVDLLRNDLGRVCEYASVRVTQPRTIESHPTVHHGVASITGRLRRRQGLVELLRAAMPGGSVSGAPKVRAMQIIDELEPVRRGVYCGSIGYIHGDVARFNIAIRTMLVEHGAGSDRVDFAVGGAVVADSDPAAEYQETLDKAVAMLNALRAER